MEPTCLLHYGEYPLLPRLFCGEVRGSRVPDKNSYVSGAMDELQNNISFFLNDLVIWSESSFISSGKVHSLWNTSYFDWSNITKAGLTSAVKHLLLHVTRSFGFTMSSSWQSGLDFIVCLCCK